MAANAIALYDSKEYHLARTSFEELSRSVKDEKVKLDCSFNVASCLASEGNFSEALEIFNRITATIKTGQNNHDVLYNMALCNYKMSNFEAALKEVNKLLLNCNEKYPELSIASNFMSHLIQGDDDDDKQLKLLHESCLVEAINLKSAILYELNQQDPRKSLACLHELPFFGHQEQLDCVTLHNLAIYESEIDLNQSISKLTHLAHLTGVGDGFNGLVPSETFRNLILLYVSNNLIEIASEFMATNASLVRKYMVKEWWLFLDIYLEQSPTNLPPNELMIYRKLNNLLDQLLAKIKVKQDGQQPTSIEERNIMVGNLIDLATIIATQECLILWNNNQHRTLEKLLDKICSNLPNYHGIIENKAHNLFMLDTRFSDCAQLYEQLLPQSTAGSLVHVDPMILGNLCVSYVLTGRNGEAEALMKDVESDEASVNDETTVAVGYGRDARTSGYSSCHINMIIGTLYCVKFNYDFGLARMFKSLVPMEQKLNIKTWLYVKRCILSLLDCHCKQMICIKDELLQQVVTFLIQCEKYGLLVEANTGMYDTAPSPADNDNSTTTGQEIHSARHGFHGQNSVTYEASYPQVHITSQTHTLNSPLATSCGPTTGERFSLVGCSI